jgi:hypothetical protein
MRAWMGIAMVAALAPLASGQTVRTVNARGGPRLAVLVPMGYSIETKDNPDGSILVKMENPVWGIDMQALIAADRAPQVTQREWQQSKLISYVSKAMTVANETDYNFRPLTLSQGTGIYCQFSAGGKESGSGDAEVYLTGGLKAWPGTVIIFRIVSNDVQSDEYREAFSVFTQSFVEAPK